MSTSYPTSVTTWPSEGVTLMIIVLVLLALSAAALRMRGATSGRSSAESLDETPAPRLSLRSGTSAATVEGEERDI